MSWWEVTDLDPVRADIKHADHASDEVADGFEVDATDTPGAVDQQHNVGLGCGLTLSVCEETMKSYGELDTRHRKLLWISVKFHINN